MAGTKGLLLGYQQRWIDDPAGVRICEKSRRIGLSWAMAAEAALTAAAARGMDVWYMGYEKTMSLEFVRDAANWAKLFHKASSQIEEGILEDGGKKIATYSIKFNSGHRITGLSSSPRGFRSRKGMAIIDEAAFVDDLPGMLKAALAFRQWGGRVCIISTHFGVENYFNELIQLTRAGRKPYSLHRITLDDALADGLYRKIAARKGEVWTPEAEKEWRDQLVREYGDDADEELFCIPSSSGGAYLTRALVESRMVPGVPVIRKEFPQGWEFRPEADRVTEVQSWLEEVLKPILESLQPDECHDFGMDFGRSGDLSVFAPLAERRDLSCHVPYMVELRNAPHEAQKQILWYCLDRMPRFRSGVMDAGGNGSWLAEVTAQKYGEERIERLHLSEAWHRDNWPRYKADLQDGTIELPRDADLLEDHRSVVVENGVPKLARTRGKGHADKKQRHGDGAMACCLANYARKRELSTTEGFASVGDDETFDMLDEYLGDF